MHLAGGRITWRLLATNNRDLGRGFDAYPSRKALRDALLALQRDAAGLAAVLTRTGPSSWGWRILAGDVTIAVASRNYQRRIQATQAAAVVLQLIPQAALGAGLEDEAGTAVVT
nr:hypothetical protein [uncultured Actinoplanes sp.]